MFFRNREESLGFVQIVVSWEEIFRDVRQGGFESIHKQRGHERISWFFLVSFDLREIGGEMCVVAIFITALS